MCPPETDRSEQIRIGRFDKKMFLTNVVVSVEWQSKNVNTPQAACYVLCILLDHQDSKMIVMHHPTQPIDIS
jgi:hypothetical protein